MKVLETGKVIEIKDNIAFVESESGAGCKSCAHKHKCMMSADNKCVIRVFIGEINLSVGDIVSFSFNESYFLGISMILYFIPAVMMLVGGIVGYYISFAIEFDPDLVTAAFAIVSLGIGFFITKFISFFKIDSGLPKVVSVK